MKRGNGSSVSLFELKSGQQGRQENRPKALKKVYLLKKYGRQLPTVCR